jgi:hypothetical protein
VHTRKSFKHGVWLSDRFVNDVGEVSPIAVTDREFRDASRFCRGVKLKIEMILRVTFSRIRSRIKKIGEEFSANLGIKGIRAD